MSAMSAIGVVVSDLEGTLTSGETWRVIGTFLEEHGRGSADRRLVYAGFPLIALSRLGLVNSQRVREQWFVRMTRLLAGLDQSAIGDLVERVVESMWANRREAVVRELEAHRQRGARLIIASGAYQLIADGFAQHLGGEGVGSLLEFDSSGCATGHLVGEVMTGAAKVRRVQERIDGARILAAYGDTEGDIPLLSLSEQPVAVCPDRVLRRVALARGWRILDA
ncbi:MAG: HAD-IB family phosphatase [Thermoflexales bacterium]|nr:HAD-IB family phosphatase [Thermoflexales bacterium]